MKVYDHRPVGECKQTVTFASMEGDLTMVSDSRFTSRRCVKERRVRRAGREFLFSNQERFSEGNGGNVNVWVFPPCTGSRGCLAIIVVGVNVGGTRLFFYGYGLNASSEADQKTNTHQHDGSCGSQRIRTHDLFSAGGTPALEISLGQYRSRYC
jgi:hypothetical protein